MNRKISKKTFLSLFFILFFCFLLSLPTILSSSFGQSILSKKLGKKFDATITLKNLNLSWFSSQSLESFSFSKKNEAMNIQAGNITNPSSLISLFLKKDTPSLTQITFFDLLFDSSIKEISEKSFKKEKKQQLIPIYNFFIKNGKVTILNENKEKTIIEDIELRVQLSPKSSILASKGKTTTQGVLGSFDLFSSFSPQDFIYEANIHATNFPVQSIDDLLHFDKTLVAAIGPTLNITSSFKICDELLDCSLEALSSQLKTSIHTEKKNNASTLQKPSFISLTITPNLINQLAKHLPSLTDLSLSADGSLQLFLDVLNIPYSNHCLDFKSLAYQGRLFSSSLNFITKTAQKPVIINASSLTSSSKNLQTELSVLLKTSLNYNLKNPSYLTTSFAITNPLSQMNLSKLSMQIGKFPLSFIEELIPNKAPLVAYLGDTLDLSISSAEEDNKMIFSLILETPLIKTEKLLLSLDRDHLFLNDPTSFTYAPSPNILNINGFVLESLGMVRGSLETFSFPLKDMANLSFNAHLKSEDVSLKAPYDLGLFKIKNSNCHLHGERLNKLAINGSLALAYMDEKPFQKELFGDLLDVDFEAVIEKQTPNDLSIPLIQLKALNRCINLSSSISLTENMEKLTFLEPLSLDLLFENKNLPIFSRFTNYSFTQPLKFSFNAKPFYLHEKLFQHLIFSSTFVADQFKVTDKIFNKEFLISKTSLTFKGDSTKQSLDGNFTSQITDQGLIFSKYHSSFFDSLQFLDHPFSLSTTLENIPLSFCDTLFGYNHALSTLFGDALQASLSINHRKDNAIIEGSIKSPNISFLYGFDKTLDALDLGKHVIDGSILLKPDSYSALEEIFADNVISKQTFALAENALIDVKVNRLRWLLSEATTAPSNLSLFDKFFSAINHHLNRSTFDALLTAKKLPLICQETDQKTTLEEFSLECIKNEGKAPFVLNIKSDVLKDKTKGQLSSSIILQSIDKGKNVISSKIKATLSQFPTMVLDSTLQLAGFKKIPPSVFLGDQINATFESQLENLAGTFDFEVDAKDAKGTVHGYLNNTALQLSEPIRAQLSITPALADFFLKNMNVSLSLAKEPLSLFIDNKGFYFPLDPFDIQSLQIRKASVNLGQIICHNLGNPQEIGSFFKLNLEKNNDISLWFAPMDFSVTKGLFYIDRTEVLFNKGYQIAFWGRLDLLKKYVNMTLGLTEQSLKKALGIKGLPRSFVLQIPLEGPINNVQINKEIATTRIALLVAKTSGLTAYGGLWGGIAGALNDFANDQTTVPPAKPPFPWGDSLSKQEQEAEDEQKINIIR